MDLFDDDAQLMLRFKGGDEACFRQIVERNKQRIFAFAYRFVGNYEDAEEIAQEVFVKVYRAKESYQPVAKFTTWLYTICKNTSLKKLRPKKPFFVFLDESRELEEDSVEREIADPHALSPRETLIYDEEAQAVKSAVDALPANQKMAVILYRFDGLSYDEIARIMHCSAKAVKSLLHRAKLFLKEKLKNTAQSEE